MMIGLQRTPLIGDVEVEAWFASCGDILHDLSSDPE